MHRSRLPLLVIAVLVAACSKRDDSNTNEILPKDPALAARIENSQNTDQKADEPPLPDACGAVAIGNQPARKNKVEAAVLVRQAYEAEILGNMRQAAELLRRASTLNWRDKASAYHLGRVDEALGDSTDAIKAYCRFLALGPAVAERREASQRVASLSRSQAQVAAATRSVVDSVTRRHSGVASTGRSVARIKKSKSVAAGAIDLPTRNEPTPATRAVVDRTDTVVAKEDAGAMRPVANVDSAKTALPTERRGASRVQAAGIGAVAGAIIGGAAGRSVGAAAIGAAAGGILGATAVRGIRPPPHGF